MKRKLIAISGKQFSGKDTFCNFLLEFLDDFIRVGIGDAIKLEYGKQKGLTFEEIEKNKPVYRADLKKVKLFLMPFTNLKTEEYFLLHQKQEFIEV